MKVSLGQGEKPRERFKVEGLRLKVEGFKGLRV